MHVVPAACVALLIVGLSGCVNTVQGSPLLSSQVDSSVPWYVVRHAKDGRDLAAEIATTLRKHGLTVSSGSVEGQPDDVHRVVHYQDNWYWDIRMYLLKLRVEVRDAESGSILGWGESHQSSLAAMGKSHQDVIDRAIQALLDDT